MQTEKRAQMMTDTSPTQWRYSVTLRQVVLLSVAYFLTAALGIYLTRDAENIAALWPANALLLGMLLRTQQGPWPGFVLGCVLANVSVNLAFGSSLPVAAGFAFCNMTEVLVATLGLRLLVPRQWRMRTSCCILAFFLVAGVLAPFVAAILGAGLLHAAYGTSYWDVLRTWWVADAIGLLLVTPVVLTANRASVARLVNERGLELVFMSVTTAAFTFYVFSQPYFNLVYSVTPLLLWAALRLGTFVTAAAALAVYSIAVGTTLNGLGPIADMSPASLLERVEFLQLFLSVEVLIPLVVAFFTAERQSLIEELERQNTELERFAYTVSHDLKGPLVTIEGFLNHLREDLRAGSREDVDQDLEEIESATHSMGELLTDLLELSKHGLVANRCQTLSLAAVLDDVLASMSDASNIALSIPDDLPPIRGDRGRLGVAVRNILDNAQKFARENQPAEVMVQAAYGPSSIDLLFEDNGIGIAKEHLERVFGLFERLDSPRPGTGVGLAIVKRIVEAHGGTVRVESDGPNGGATVAISLPRSETATASGTGLDTPPGGSPSRPFLLTAKRF